MSGWQDIATAPKDKAIIVASGLTVGEACFISGIDFSGWFWASDPERMPVPPTHWQPLPAPPRDLQGHTAWPYDCAPHTSPQGREETPWGWSEQ